MYYRDAYFPKVTEQKNNCVRARRIDQHPHGLCPATGFVEIVDLTRPMPLMLPFLLFQTQTCAVMNQQMFRNRSW